MASYILGSVMIPLPFNIVSRIDACTYKAGLAKGELEKGVFT